jgi:hypothetical protein
MKNKIENLEMLNEVVMEDYFDIIMEVTGDAMMRSADEIAPQYGAKDYNEAYQIMNRETYRYDYLENVMDNAVIDLNLLKEQIDYFLEENDVEFDINLNKYFFDYVKGNLSNWE